MSHVSSIPSLFSVIIPGFNRLEPLKFTLRSAAEAARHVGEAVEIIVVDDGSEPPLAEALKDFPVGHPVNYVRQPNQGSIVARLAGLQHARGRYVLFLDSDDLVVPEKLRAHADALSAHDADVVYDDHAVGKLGPEYSARFSAGLPLPVGENLLDTLIHIQPLPHGASYRREWLLSVFRDCLIPPHRRFDPAGDVWLYYNLLLHPGRAHKVPLPLTAIGPHDQTRYSHHWEKIGVAALHVAEEFMRRCPVNDATEEARRTVGEAAFNSWRRLPRDFNASYNRRLLAIWRKAPPSRLHKLGERGFVRLAHVVGPLLAGRLLRLRSHRYADCRTIDDAELARLLAH